MKSSFSTIFSHRKLLTLISLAWLCLPGTAWAGTVLTQQEAATRATQIGDVSYKLFFTLNATDKTYTGTSEIDFNLRKDPPGEATFIDFQGGEISSLTVNGKRWKTFDYSGDRLRLPFAKLNAKRNHISIGFKRSYNSNGRGLHRFEDPADGKVYMYTNLEPYAAREVFPCFDQPDLKASYTMTVIAPKDWKVIANTTEREVKRRGANSIWRFPKSARFSTYIWALHAGPYESWRSVARTRYGATIPMRVLVRESEMAYVEPEYWFRLTAAGFDFFHEKFGVAYPFAKYDQIIVPEFNHGAMENVAAVTFSERYLNRTPPTAKDRLDHAEVILHELAHMWFGNLVTMKWWNDLWLNESFASFTASWALAEVGKKVGIENAWQGFFVDMKQWAYWLDQLVITHPILAEVKDTSAAFSIFDGITYGKGGSALKQLYYYLGDEKFSRGLRIYFERHAYGNTVLNDFIGALGEAAQLDLGDWQTAWLQSKGQNTLSVDWQCKDGKINRFDLLQGFADGEADKLLRPHRTRVALLSEKDDKLHTSDVFPVAYQTKRTPVPGAIGKPCPAAVLPNHEDFDYTKVILDSRSLRSINKKLSNIADPLVRVMFWHALFESMVDGRLPPADYAKIVLRHIPPENDFLVLVPVLIDLNRDLSSHRRSATRANLARYLGHDARADFLGKMEDIAYARFLTAPTESDFQTLWFETFLTMMHRDKAINIAHAWLAKEETIGFKLNNARRWRIVINLARNGHPDADKLIAAELKRENSDFARDSALTARAAMPGKKNKQDWFERVARKDSDEEKLPFGKMRKVMVAFQSLAQEDDTEFTKNHFFSELPALSKREREPYLDAYSELMFPGHCDEKVIEAGRAFLKQHGDSMPIDVVKNIKVGVQEAERCLRARIIH